MSERWVKESEQLLKTMNELSSKEKKDRLETLNSIIFALNVLERSIYGWKLWLGNLSLMTEFTSEELEEIEQSLKKQIQPFVEYDIQATQKWIDKLPPVPKGFSGPKRIGERAETRSMYV